MDILSLMLIAVALSMDAFAVAVSSGIIAGSIRMKNVVKVGLFFGIFQGLMPLLGYLLGQSFSVYISAVDHYVAFALLAFIGIRMIIGAMKEHDGEEAKGTDPFATKTLFIMAIATSIDALAVGVSFALTDVKIIPAALLITGVTFALSCAGVVLGRKVGAMFRKRAEIIGGVILVCIGAKILIEHLSAG